MFTKIDLALGYHSIKIAEGHEFKTTFTTYYGTYEWLVLPLSLTNMLPLSLNNSSLVICWTRVYWSILTIYLYLALILSCIIMMIYKTLEQLCENKLKVKGSKCKFVVTKVEYLGHIVENGTVAMDPEKIRVVGRLASS